MWRKGYLLNKHHLFWSNTETWGLNLIESTMKLLFFSYKYVLFFFFFFRLKFSEKKFRSRKESTAKLSLNRILERVGGRTVTQVIIHHNRSTIFLFPPLGVICKFSLPDRLSLQPQADDFFPASWGSCVVVGGSAEATWANVAVYFHSVMCVNLITGR